MQEMMVQQAPYPEILEKLVQDCEYRPGWFIKLEDIQNRDTHHGKDITSGGLTLVVTSVGYDSYHPERGENYRVNHYFPVPPATYNEQSWRRWLFNCFVKIETHECAEFFQINGERPYAPNHGPGNDPYVVFEIGTEEGQRTSFRGEVKGGS